MCVLDVNVTQTGPVFVLQVEDEQIREQMDGDAGGHLNRWETNGEDDTRSGGFACGCSEWMVHGRSGSSVRVHAWVGWRGEMLWVNACTAEENGK